jgi:hypothetical protein
MLAATIAAVAPSTASSQTPLPIGELIATTGHHEGIMLSIEEQQIVFDNIHVVGCQGVGGGFLWGGNPCVGVFPPQQNPSINS